MHPQRRSQSHESPFLSLPILIILLPILTLLVLFFTVPPVISFTSQVLRPHAVRKSWDSLNIFIVLFAILCGILTRKNDDVSETNINQEKLNDVVNVSSGGDIGSEYSDEKIFQGKVINTSEFGAPVTGYGRFKRNSSSYPDLRQESIWDTGESSLRLRFFDDFEVNKYSSYYNTNVHSQRSSIVFEDSDVKEISVDRFVLHSQPPPPSKSPPPPPPPPPPRSQVVQRKPRRTHDKDAVLGSMQTQQPPPPPPPPPARHVQMNYQEQKYSKRGRKKINARKEIKMFVSALYKQRKKKMQHKDKVNSFQAQSEVDHYMSYRQSGPRPPPPPPPPPPPHSVFHNLFKKGSKSKKVHSYSPPPSPPPPPKTKKKTRKPPPQPELPAQLPIRKTADALPPRPNRAVRTFNKRGDHNLNTGNESPSIPMPPPPPELKFMVRGDFVKVRSAQSSRCSSPELEDIESSSSDIGNVLKNGGDIANSVFCPSPDVNVKADTFIARLKDGWRLEKINSLREKQTGLLGPESRTISSHF